MKYIVIYLIVINFLSFLFCAIDKSRARKGKRRIRERTLFTLCFLGGCPAMFITMLTIRHKTLHKRFMFGIPLIFLLQLIIILILALKFPSLLTFLGY